MISSFLLHNQLLTERTNAVKQGQTRQTLLPMTQEFGSFKNKLKPPHVVLFPREMVEEATAEPDKHS
ncbi:hypothetical protein SAMN05421863_100733 [Nitrosomonas communis]|uniref:Uncharacterized protein n=1 Tax=Nitrosomonas communis TaxID=44574 RepID=A0A1I4LP80_9PROT|nr:hypothetical protein SAMN05421863_100733 [Nitrosomonas communis]